MNIDGDPNPQLGSDLMAFSMVSRVCTSASAPPGMDTPYWQASTMTRLTLASWRWSKCFEMSRRQISPTLMGLGTVPDFLTI